MSRNLFSVIDHLDVLKKDNSGSREAIRWLETEFRKGSRYPNKLISIGFAYLCEFFVFLFMFFVVLC